MAFEKYPYKIKVSKLKRCSKCGRLLVACKVNFYKDKNGKYGFRAQCKECCKKNDKERNSKYNKRTIYTPNEIVVYEELGYAEILLYNRQGIEVGRALIDISDIPLVSQHKWHLNSKGYVKSKINGKDIRLHRFIMNVWEQEYDYTSNCVDHINRNKLDNRKDNLNICSQADNNRNIDYANRNISTRNTSGVKGVYYDNTKNKWVAEIIVNGNRNRKRFKTKEQAIEYRRLLELEYWGFSNIDIDNIEI